MVYAAEHLFTRRPVAVKVPHDSAPSSMLARVRREMEALALVRGEGVVEMLDAGEVGGKPYIVFELLEGRTLAGLLASRGQLSPDEVAKVGIDVARALEHCHERGVIHRDIKPSNLFVTLGSGGHVKVLDFGIAKLSGAETVYQPKLTQETAVLGTPEYMAPEMAAGTNVDARADLYAIGLILYELVCWRRPFEGSDFEVMKAHIERRPEPPTKWRQDLPPQLEHVIMRALEKRPQDRYESALAMQKALRRVAVEIMGKGEWKPLLGEWLAPAAMTHSMQSPPTERMMKSAATVPLRARRPSKEPPRPPPRKRAPIALVASIGIVGVAIAVVATHKSSEPQVAQKPALREAPPPPPPVVAAIAPDAPVVEPEVPVMTDVKHSKPARRVAATQLDLHDVDWRGFLPTAEAMAKQNVSDAKLVEIEFYYVPADGRLDTAKETAIDYFFTGQRDAYCGYKVRIDRDGAEGELRADRCSQQPERRPQCTLRQVREKLHAKRPDVARERLEVVRYQDGRWVLGGMVIEDTCDATVSEEMPAYSHTAFDWRAYFPNAQSMARKIASDAKLVGLHFRPVSRDGTIDLTKGGPTEFVFRAATPCTITVVVGEKVAYRTEGTRCDAPVVSMPRCSLADVRSRAVVDDAMADVSFDATGWHVVGTNDHIIVADSCR